MIKFFNTIPHIIIGGNNMKIQIQNLSKAYANEYILDELS